MTIVSKMGIVSGGLGWSRMWEYGHGDSDAVVANAVPSTTLVAGKSAIRNWAKTVNKARLMLLYVRILCSGLIRKNLSTTVPVVNTK